MQLSVVRAAAPHALPRLGVRSLRRFALRGALTAIVASCVLLGGPPSVELRIRQEAAPLTFRLLDWEVSRIAERAPRIVAGLLGRHQHAGAADRQAAAAYFAASAGARDALRPEAEAAVERALGSVAATEGLTLGVPLLGADNLVFPPVSFSFVAPPRLLVVSPRERIEVRFSQLLQSDVTIPQATSLEADADRLDVSSLVVEIGGLASYPAMVVEGPRPLDSLTGVAHEWVHAFLFLHPLGQAYWSHPAARSINETATDMAARELGRRLAAELGLEPGPAPAPRREPGGGRSARSVLRETRVDVDRLLAAGQVEAVEALMRQRRDELAAMGHEIRKLNQAYFAFHGSYGDAAAGGSPIPGRLQRLRESSHSVGEFLRRVAQLRDGRDLARAVGDA